MPVIPGVVKLGSKNLRFRRKLAQLPHHLQFLTNLRHIQFSRRYTNLENYGITCVMLIAKKTGFTNVFMSFRLIPWMFGVQSWL